MFAPKEIPASQIPTGLWAQFQRQMPGYLVGTLLLAIYQGSQYVFNVQLREATDAAVGGASERALRLGIELVLLAMLALVARVLSRVTIFDGGRLAEYELRRAVMYHLHRLGPAFYRRMSSGEIMSRSTNDLTQVRLLLGFGVLNAINTVFALISALAFTLSTSLMLTLVSLGPLPVMVLAMRRFAKTMYERQRDNQRAIGVMSSQVQSSIAGVRVVRSFALEDAEFERFRDVNNEYQTHALRLANLRAAMFPAMQALTAIGLVAVVWYGSHLIRVGELSPGDLIAFIRALGQLTWPIISLGFLVSLVQRGRAAHERLEEIYATVPDMMDGPLPAPEHLEGGLRVHNLTFAYGNENVLENVSFELAPGESLAIVGRTGSGKSTLAVLLARLQNTPRGAIFLDDVDVCDLPLASVRNSVGYAQQDAFLFSTTVARNIGYVLADADGPEAMRVIEMAADEAQIKAEVAELPDHWDTVVGERGVQLSGGQKQRVSLARAFVSQPKILILDDPLSAVDAHAETQILNAIERQRGKRGLILITHRVSAACRCDQILVLDEGRVIERGTHAELLGARGVYAMFAEEQRLESAMHALGEAPLESLPPAPLGSTP